MDNSKNIETPKRQFKARWGSVRSDSSTQADTDSPMTPQIAVARRNRRRTLEERNEGRNEGRNEYESDASEDETEEPSCKPYFLYNSYIIDRLYMG